MAGDPRGPKPLITLGKASKTDPPRELIPTGLGSLTLGLSLALPKAQDGLIPLRGVGLASLTPSSGVIPSLAAIAPSAAPAHIPIGVLPTLPTSGVPSILLTGVPATPVAVQPAIPVEAPPAPVAKAPEYKEYIVERDNERPFSFAGVELGKATLKALTFESTTAAVYRTRGGKYIATLAREDAGSLLEVTSAFSEFIDDGSDGAASATRRSGYRKAQVFDSLDAALGWFKPGRLTERLRKTLGLSEPIRIE